MTFWSARWREFLAEHPELLVDPEKPYYPLSDTPAKLLASDEAFWQGVRERFPSTQVVSNLNNGAVSTGSFIVERAFTRYYSLMNEAPSYYIWKIMEQGRELIRQGLAGLINAEPDEVAILRNTTEALNNMIFGLPLKGGDEVVACRQDYLKAISSWKQREMREGVKLVWVNLEGPGETDDSIVEKYVAAFTEQTKLVQLTHVINWNGQVMPVKRIIDEARKRNIEVLLDGAHSFGLLETDMKKLGCDYFTTALHKWLSGPIPSAMLYVAKSKIQRIWPLASSLTPQADNIRKFEELSIQLLPNVLGLGYAIEFLEWLGRENKEQRLRYLRSQLITALKPVKGLSFLTPLEENRLCTILSIALEGWAPAKLEKELLQKYKVHVGMVQWENMQGIRITPNIYTRTDELHKAAAAIKELAGL